VFGRRLPAQQPDIMGEPRDILPPPASRPRHPFVVYNGGRDTQPGEKVG
jgi:hypothetical protein